MISPSCTNEMTPVSSLNAMATASVSSVIPIARGGDCQALWIAALQRHGRKQLAASTDGSNDHRPVMQGCVWIENRNKQVVRRVARASHGLDVVLKADVALE